MCVFGVGSLGAGWLVEGIGWTYVYEYTLFTTVFIRSWASGEVSKPLRIMSALVMSPKLTQLDDLQIVTVWVTYHILISRLISRYLMTDSLFTTSTTILEQVRKLEMGRMRLNTKTRRHGRYGRHLSEDAGKSGKIYENGRRKER